MRKKLGLVLVLATLAAAPAPADESDPPASPDQTSVEDIIAARQTLMTTIEELMQPIDTFTVDESVDTDVMRANANTISAMLLAVPHLFPERTNLYDADDEYPVTIAMPAIWESFSTFYTLASAASESALRLAETSDDAELRDASLGLRGACDACHANYLLPYEPAPVNRDSDFDFDSIFED